MDAVPLDDLTAILEVLEQARDADRQIFIAGNGGSAATASHMANDLVWGMAQVHLRPFRCIALTDNLPLATAIANDDAYEAIFAHPLRALGRAGDVLLVISGSGNSPNVVRAVEVAREIGLTTLGFLGFDGGRVAPMLDRHCIVPSRRYGPIEDLHLVFDHLAISWFRAREGRS